MALTKESSGQAPRPRDRKRDRDHKQGALEEAHGNGRVRIQRLVNPRSAGGAQGARSVRTQTRNPRGQARSPQTFRGETCAASLSQQGQDLFRPRSDETGGNPWGTHPGSSPHPVRVGTPGTQTFPGRPGPKSERPARERRPSLRPRVPAVPHVPEQLHAPESPHVPGEPDPRPRPRTAPRPVRAPGRDPARVVPRPPRVPRHAAPAPRVPATTRSRPPREWGSDAPARSGVTPVPGRAAISGCRVPEVPAACPVPIRR